MYLCIMSKIFTDLFKELTTSITYRKGYYKIKWIAGNPGYDDIGFSEEAVNFANLCIKVIDEIGFTQLYTYGKCVFKEKLDFSIEHSLIAYLLNKYKNIDVSKHQDLFCKYVEAFQINFYYAEAIAHDIDIIRSLGWAEGAVELSHSEPVSYEYLSGQPEYSDFMVSIIDMCNEEINEQTADYSIYL